MPVRVEEHGFDSPAYLLYGQKLVWEEEGIRREGIISFSTSFGIVVLRTSNGECKTMK
jgi:hypothetical protein